MSKVRTVIVELEHPTDSDNIYLITDISDEYYGVGKELVHCKDCKWFSEVGYCDLLRFRIVDSYKYCAWAERKEK